MPSLIWAGGEHDFDLSKLGEMRALQQACEASPPIVAERLRAGAWMVDDIAETLRIGLIGGGMGKDLAVSVVNGAWEKSNKLELAQTAYVVLAAAFVGDFNDDEEVPSGEAEPPTEKAPSAGGSQKSTEPESSSDLSQEKSTN